MTARRRLPAHLALVLVSGVLASGALATTYAVQAPRDGSAVTPVERFRQQALADGRTAAAGPAGQESSKDLQRVYSFDMQLGHVDGKRFDPKDQGTDLEFFTTTAAVPHPDPEMTDEAGRALPLTDADGKVVTGQRDFAVVGSYDRGAFVFDITDPEKTRFVQQIVCQQKQNDIQIRRFGERWVVVLTNDQSGVLCAGPKTVTSPAPPTQTPGLPNATQGGAAVFDITNPYAPAPMYNLHVHDGVHNFTWHPTQPVAWISTGDLPGGVDHLPVYDFTDPDNPKLVADLTVEGGPHDITFSDDGSKAYVASENNVRVYDAKDPRNPRLLYRGPSLASYVHGADPTPDGKTLLVTDESLVLGGFFTARTAVCPGGGITLFDATSEPLKPLSYLLADVQGQTPDHRACTAHVGRFTPDSKHYVTGWYVGGVRLFDISDPRAPKEIAHAVLPKTEVWSAKFHKGPYVYAGDLGRGFDVYKYTGPAKLGVPPVTAGG
jgi:hypothetical protein